MKRLLFAAAFACITDGARAAPYADSPVARALRDELARSMDKLEMGGFGKPYFLSYSLYDATRTYVTAALGALATSQSAPARSVYLDLRVGDYDFDNSNVVDAERASVALPAEDDYDLVRRELWLATDRSYKRAVETLGRKRAVAKAETRSPDEPPSFTKEVPSKITDERALPPPDMKRLEALAKKLSAVFRANPDVHEGTATISGLAGKHYFVSSEGASSVETGSYARLDLECHAQADDGMPLHATATIWAHAFDQLPPEAELIAQAEKLSKELSALRKAPVIADYDGPVLFTGTAAGDVVRALLADELGGTPAPKSDRPGGRGIESALVGKVDRRILPPGTTLVDDPTIDRLGKAPLVGGGKFDDEGVPTQKVTLVENGMFKRFLMSRAPRAGYTHSNGHGSWTAHGAVRAAPANLLLSSSAGVSDADLRRRAASAAREQGLTYYLAVERLEQRRYRGDITNPGEDLSLPRPALLRRIYLDGRQELVRGASFGTVPMKSLKDLLALGATPTVITYQGRTLTSIAAPGLLFRDLDVKKPQGPQKQRPIAPRPPP
ncbi:MAG: hypothetical protein KF773_06075 [Deltaproteobacteria bacterium]|nr:hypothetical protein [Deltaproteobacteria bacterium]